jgi:membrane-associated phospholipid phosphatase
MGLASSAIGVGGALLVDRQTVQADESARSADQRCQQIEPSAGSWKTWVLTSGREFRDAGAIGPPPSMAATQMELQTVRENVASVNAATLDRIRFWDAGAVYRWMDLISARVGQGTATSDSTGQPVGGLGSSRPHALVVVAIYDAVIAAWDAKYAFNRLRPSELDPQLQTVIPNPRSPSYPSEHAAVAWAAATVMNYLYPTPPGQMSPWDALADEDGKLRVMAGVEYPSDVQAGKTLGTLVGNAMIDRRAKHDNFPGSLTATPPASAINLYPGEDLWTPDPVATFPSAGTWKPWVISGPEAFDPGPYPSRSSAAGTVDIFGADPAHGQMGVLNWDRTLDQTHGGNLSHNFEALLAQNPPGMLQGEVADLQRRIQEERLEDNPPRTARAHALSAIAKHDANVAVFAAKYQYWRIRPYQLNKIAQFHTASFSNLFPTPKHPSYPAAHGAGSGAAYAIAAYLFSREADALNQEGATIAESRLWAGIHYQTDIDAGLAQGRAVAAEVIKVANADGSNSGDGSATSPGALPAKSTACPSDR